jgi:hypothetical protein
VSTNDASLSEAMRRLRPFMHSGEVLSVSNPSIAGATVLMVRVAKRSAGLEQRIRNALRGPEWRVEIAEA